MFNQNDNRLENWSYVQKNTMFLKFDSGTREPEKAI